MKKSDRDDQQKKLENHLLFCKEKMLQAKKEKNAAELQEAKNNYYYTLAELDKIQPKSKN